MSNWAVLCPGPSLSKVKSIQAALGCVIAVNSAILRFPETTRFWAMLDGEVFASCAGRIDLKKLAAKPVTLWTHHNFENSGRSADWNHETHELFRTFSALQWKNLSMLLPVGSDIEWQNYSFFTAIALAIIGRARLIRVYGADLDGNGYFTDGFTNFRTDHRPARWEHESEAFRQVIKYCNVNNLARIEMMKGPQ